MYLTPAFLRHYTAALGVPIQQLSGMSAYVVRLRRGDADWRSFAAAATRLDPQVQLSEGGSGAGSGGGGNGLQAAAATAQRGIHLEVVALAVFGGLALLVTLLLAGQAMGRQVLLERDDFLAMGALGASPSQVRRIVVARSAVIGPVGGTIAFGVAVLASPLMPIGLARQAEVTPGFRVEPWILVPGYLTLVVLVASLTVIPAWRLTRSSRRSDQGAHGSRPSRLADSLAEAPIPPPTVIGVRFALERGRGRSAVPLGTAMVSGIGAVAALVAALTFGTSLNYLASTPPQQGWNWDVLVANPNTPTDQSAADEALLDRNPLVGSYSALTVINGGGFAVDGHRVGNTLAVDPVKGNVGPPLLQGRAPQAADEIVLGSATLAAIHRHVGQAVRYSTPAGASTMTIVGSMIMPSIGDQLVNSVGEGAWIPNRYFQRLKAEAAALPNAPPLFYDIYAVRYVPGVSHAAAFASLERQFGPTVLQQLPAEDVVNLQSVDRLPFILAGLIGLLGVAAVGNTLVAFVHRRRRDLAILKGHRVQSSTDRHHGRVAGDHVHCVGVGRRRSGRSLLGAPRLELGGDPDRVDITNDCPGAVRRPSRSGSARDRHRHRRRSGLVGRSHRSQCRVAP
jgi:hypothetical protein